MTLPRTNTTKRFSHSNFSNFPWANQRSTFCSVPCVLGGNIIILGHYSRLVVHEHADDVLVMSVMTINGGQSAMSDGGTQMWKFSDTRSHFPIICFVNVNTGPRSSSSWDTWHVTRAGSSHTYTRVIDKIRVCPWFPYISVISAQCGLCSVWTVWADLAASSPDN